MAPKSTPKDVFMHLLAMAALYISAVSFGTLAFQLIDRWFPDPLADYYRSFSGPMRWALASLVIVFPVYLGVQRSIQKDMTANVGKSELRIRKWLLYFTLFAAAAVIIGDLVALVYNFLGGDLTARFVLKVVAVLFIAAAVFSYYLWNLRHARSAFEDPQMRWYAYGVIVIVLAGVVYGFYTVGSPFAERLRRFDERRVQDLQSIQWQVINYWQRKDKLPEKLDDLRDPISGFIPPSDPEASAAYEYRALGNLTFELCATFQTDSNLASESSSKPLSVAPPFGMGDNWAHGIGRVCFERTIDPELYSLDKPARPR